MAEKNELRQRCRSVPMVISSGFLLALFYYVFESRHELQELVNTPQTSHRVMALASALHPHHHHGVFSDAEATANAEEVHRIREEVYAKCRNATFTALQVSQTLQKQFRHSLIQAGTHEDSLPLQACSHVFLDFGANVGDSLAKFVDAGMGRCVKQVPLHPNDRSALFNARKRGNPLIQWALRRFKTHNNNPEDYCYFGLEGNPHFTQQLQQLERQVMRMTPRPVRRAHFFTESVGTNHDGLTTMYLDTINEFNQFWGSSLLPTHTDVLTSAKRTHDGHPITVTVQGYSLTTLLARLVQPIQGGHVFIKSDIEGAEYALLNEGADSLCRYVQEYKVEIDILVELHGQPLIGENEEADRYRSETKGKLVDCGVNLVEGEAGRR